jgi:uncharacterized membrane protein YphA (DoxX/SURF4 family)
MTTQIEFNAPTVGFSTKTAARWATTAARIVLGLVFFAAGLTWFLNLVPPPSGPMSDGAMALGGGLMKSGYMFPLIKGTEVVVGALLLSNRFVPLAIAVIAPVVVNIVAFHAFLAPEGIAVPIVILVLELCLAWSYRSAYRSMLAARTTTRAA